MVKITDAQIVEAIGNQITSSKIAKKYGVSKSAVSQRIKKLINSGVIFADNRTSYKSLSLEKPTKLNSFRWGKETTHRVKETCLRAHRFRYGFSIVRDNKTYDLPIKKFLRNRVDQYTQDGKIWRTTKHVFFWIKKKNFKGDYEQLEKYSKQLAVNFQRYSGIILDISHPDLKQEIGVTSKKFKGIFNDKQEVFRQKWKHVYPNAPEEVEVYDQETAYKLIDNLCVIDAKSEIIHNMQSIVSVQKDYSEAIKKHLEAVSKISSGMDKFTNSITYLEQKQKNFEDRVKKVIGEIL